MTQSKKISDSTPSPDPLDDHLAHWGSQFECSQEQIAAMWSRVAESMASDLPSGDETTSVEGKSLANLPSTSNVSLIHWSIRCTLAAVLLIAVGLGLARLTNPHRGSRLQVHSAKDSLAEFAFTDEELREKRALAGEFYRLCLKPVFARKTNSGWYIDDSPDADESGMGQSHKSAMVIRCLFLESNVTVRSSSESWRVVDQEEIITNLEYQRIATNKHPGDVDAWLHLLPDQSLWTECHDEVRDEACLLRQNEPKIVWEESSKDSVGRRFVIVYQCLDIDNV